MKSKLKNARAFRYGGNNFQYLIVYDYNSGKRNRYTVVALGGLDGHGCAVIGRELPFGCAKEIARLHNGLNDPYGTKIDLE